ncbi:MAG TPA: hypothetical protein VMW92_01065 [Candidatus Heimdallarchaeota archaeon]|nr:hypothetical protein [Candidatus Heimdallarchaeota archaeon]
MPSPPMEWCSPRLPANLCRCAPSWASLASGRRPSDINVMTNNHLYPPDVLTYYQSLRLAGYRVGMVAKRDLHKRDH